ncbi:MAG: hypothetical protein A2902_05095 [Elusimicrobia bacterium RIFCSPLOWO2_01_FULL_64_13]|nr:MAG: hypothetical protein A2636_02545 [Elusimicrobia bacterium RIFCSPHIGHO2_01_FULL_64_10]OGR97121.1 MAG: hypothetical protein A2902_05095 [Elusimicrobia bacterium RIFCSPLOWO2_01_FULL_64_13]
MDAMLGLVVAAIGLMTFVIAFTLADRKKQVLSYGIAGIVTIAGLFYYTTAEMRGYQMRRRIADIQKQQQVNLQEIQQRLGRPQAPRPAAAPEKR